MRVVGLAVLVGAVLITAASVAHFGRFPTAAPGAAAAPREIRGDAQLNPTQSVDSLRPIAPGPRPPSAAAAAHEQSASAHDPPRPRHEFLADRARAGDAAAALELLGLLEACAERDETTGMMKIIEQDWGPARACADSEDCAATENEFDQLRDSLSRSRAAEPDCRSVPRAWITLRGRWLERAAELGDPEARACYALAGVELAPQAFNQAFAAWMENWRRQALPWAWDAWRSGDPRAALALARIYAPSSNFGGDIGLTEPDQALADRFALLLTRALDLGPHQGDPALDVHRQAAPSGDDARGDEEAWVEAQLPRVEQGLGTASRTPNQCWQHFAVFESKQEERASKYTAAR